MAVAAAGLNGAVDDAATTGEGPEPYGRLAGRGNFCPHPGDRNSMTTPTDYPSPTPAASAAAPANMMRPMNDLTWGAAERGTALALRLRESAALIRHGFSGQPGLIAGTNLIVSGPNATG